ncbi:MAG TPA: ABATE domain-containing protein [Gammaproteobacteria bacterium]|nr:ABATE domain-containing protein [Gammaproteobacteria bacterium]
MKNISPQLEGLDRVGGHPALDFINTVHAWHGEEPGEDHLIDFAHLLRWNQLADLVGPRGSQALDSGSLAEQEAAVAAARTLRQHLHKLFQAVVANTALPQASLDYLNAVIRDTVRWRKIAAQGARVGCSWNFTGAPPAAIIGPVAWKAVDLLEFGPVERIKQCPSDNCAWLFLDTSKNRSRTWCSMKACGNSAKVRAFRARQTA